MKFPAILQVVCLVACDNAVQQKPRVEPGEEPLETSSLSDEEVVPLAPVPCIHRPVAERKTFLLRIEPSMLEALQRLANDELRSVNAQMEFLLREALRQAGRLKEAKAQRRGMRKP